MATHAVPGTGLELILNAAEGVLQIVVTEDEAILCAQEWYRSERATEILAPALAELATSLGIRWSDLRRIACVRGPGSFTGIRLVLAVAERRLDAKLLRDLLLEACARKRSLAVRVMDDDEPLRRDEFLLIGPRRKSKGREKTT